MKRLIINGLFYVLVVVCAGCSSGNSIASGLDCSRAVIDDDYLVRIHDEQKRVFMARKEVTRDSLVFVIQKLEECLVDHDWKK